MVLVVAHDDSAVEEVVVGGEVVDDVPGPLHVLPLADEVVEVVGEAEEEVDAVATGLGDHKVQLLTGFWSTSLLIVVPTSPPPPPPLAAST